MQFSKQQNSSKTPGEIDPADIQISGGLFYQNNFMLDGFNINNDLNPANSGSYTAVTDLPGRSQGLNIDSSLLDSITVLDSNISASYGGFNGGVVEANTRRASKKFSTNISYQITQGNANPSKFSLTQYHIYAPNDTDYQSFLNSDNASNQPEFIKHSIRASVESLFADNAGIIASFSTIQSFIPLNSYATSYLTTTLDDTRKTQKRQSYNLFLKGHYDVLDNLTLEAQYAYMPQYNNYFIRNTKNSNFDFLTGGHQGGLKTLWDSEVGSFTAQFNVNYMDNSRVNSAKNMMGWRASAEKNWTNNLQSGTVSEGSYGNVHTKQINTTLKITQDFKALTIGNWSNYFNIGGEYSYTNAYYERMEDMYYFSFGDSWLSPLTNGQTCLAGDITCSTSPVYYQIGKWANNVGQYANRTYFYKAGKINLDNHAFSAFIEDDMKFELGESGDMNMRIGLRLDYDTLMNKATFAPRFALNYMLPWNKWESGKNFATQITFGANRYYGRNLFAYKLLDSRSALQYTLTRSSPTISWDNATSTQTKNDTNFKKIRVPYSDEFMGGITQKIYMFVINAKYIYRQGRDEIRRMCQAPDGSISALSCTSNANQSLRYVYTNEGRSDSEIIQVSISNDGGLDFWEVKNYIMFAFDFTNVRRNYNDYNTNMSADELNNELIWYGGQVVRYDNKPATNFAQPYTFRLNTITTFPLWKTKWAWNNFFSLKSPYYAMASIGQKTQKWSDLKAQYPEITAAFEKFRVPFSFQWDIRIGFEIDIYSGNTLYFNLDIINVLNNKNLIIESASYADNAGATAIPVYEVGRQFWLQMGYKF